jgi:hypothetical protein
MPIILTLSLAVALECLILARWVRIGRALMTHSQEVQQ